MASIGGLDVPYGSQTQLCRTNVLVVETDASQTTNTVAAAATVLSRAKQVFPSALSPDYIACVASGALTEGYYDTHSGEIADNGVLAAITAVPVAGASMGATATSQRALAWDSILNVGIVQLNTDNTGVADDLFTDGGDTNDTGEMFYASDLQGQLMTAQMAAGNYTSGSGSTHGVGGDNGRVMTLDLTGLLTDSAVLGGTAVTNISAITATSTLDAINDTLSGAAAIVSIMSLASLV
jgi:hypothetical protein